MKLLPQFNSERFVFGLVLLISAAVSELAVARVFAQEPNPPPVAIDDGSQATETENETVAEEDSLPIPPHPDRPPLHYQNSLPAASQDNRERHAPPNRRAYAPVPGRPSRGLPPPGESESESAEDPEALEDEQPPSGALPRLPHQMGSVVGQYTYTGESFTVAHGGLNTSQATDYRGVMDVTMELDTSRAGWWERGRFFLYGFSAHGSTLSADHIGDLQLYSNIDTAPRDEVVRVGEAYYEQVVREDLLRVKVGLLDANADFAISDLGASFIGSSFAMPPSVALTTWPFQRFGGVAFLNLREDLVLATGVFDIGTNIGQFGFDSVDAMGALTLVQLEWKTNFGAYGELPHTLRVGGWSVNGEFDEINSPAPATYNQNGGGWVIVDQMIRNENPCEPSDQGLSVFFQYGWAPSDRNYVADYYGGGIVYKGLLDGRDSDLCGIGLAAPLLTDRVTPPGATERLSERAIESFYRVQISEYIMVQPELIYILTPSGEGQDALVAGCRFQVVL